ncbi:hypothetical protein ANN_06791 [Periplaneta americana]|uniref:DUF4817 domain-containing protein n=1 Tax=Periplaneta americana TaxID=6978 RepID=A0ABQ8TGX3_PERAM|nr:hypothetical protein ANN_06791 [Periplaneta americana]
MYGKADGNSALPRRLYQERYPQRQCPDRKTFVRLHYHLCEYGKFNSPGLGRGRPRSTTPEVQEEILEAVNMTPSISTRRVALQVNVPHTTVWRLLKEYQLSMRHRCEVCIQAGGGHFEHLCNDNDLKKEKRSARRLTLNRRGNSTGIVYQGNIGVLSGKLRLLCDMPTNLHNHLIAGVVKIRFLWRTLDNDSVEMLAEQTAIEILRKKLV